MDYVCGIVFFDLDGALVRGTTARHFMAARLRSEAAVIAAEKALARGEIDRDELLRVDAAAWKRHTPAEVHAWLDELPLARGVEDVVGWCRQRALAPYVTSCAWNFVGNHLCDRYDFEGCYGSVLEERAGMFSGRVAAAFDEGDQRIWAEDLTERLYLEPSEAASVGASLLGRTIASGGDDLRAVLPALQAWHRGK